MWIRNKVINQTINQTTQQREWDPEREQGAEQVGSYRLGPAHPPGESLSPAVCNKEATGETNSSQQHSSGHHTVTQLQMITTLATNERLCSRSLETLYSSVFHNL